MLVLPPGPPTKTESDAAAGIKPPAADMSLTAEKQLEETFLKLGSGMSGDETGVLGDVAVVQGSGELPFIRIVKRDWWKRT